MPIFSSLDENTAIDLLAAAPYRSKSRNMYLGKFGLEFTAELNIDLML